MAINGKIVVKFEHGVKKFVFQISKRKYFYVDSFENGIVVIKPELGTTIRTFAKIVVGCFEEESNFKSEICKAFHYDEATTEIKEIHFDYTVASLMVTRENADKNKICSAYKAAVKNWIKY